MTLVAAQSDGNRIDPRPREDMLFLKLLEARTVALSAGWTVRMAHIKTG